MSNVTHIGPRSIGASMALPDSFLKVADAIGLPVPNWSEPKAFTIRRRKYEGRWGWEIGLRIGALWLNLEAHGVAPFPPTKAKAREWCVAFAQQHGFDPIEEARRECVNRPPSLRVVPPETD